MGICNSPSLFTVKVGRAFSGSSTGLGSIPGMSIGLRSAPPSIDFLPLIAFDSGLNLSRLESNSLLYKSSNFSLRWAAEVYLSRSPMYARVYKLGWL